MRQEKEGLKYNAREKKNPKKITEETKKRRHVCKGKSRCLISKQTEVAH